MSWACGRWAAGETLQTRTTGKTGWPAIPAGQTVRKCKTGTTGADPDIPTGLSMIDTLHWLDDLRKVSFGCDFPRHGLKLLYWFAVRCVKFYPGGIMRLRFDPDTGHFGFHHYGNYEKLLPEHKHFCFRYFVVGNLNPLTHQGARDLPKYVRGTYDSNGSFEQNKDRIIISFNDTTNIITDVYITEHWHGSKDFRPDGTYLLSPLLLKKIQHMTLTDFLTRTTTNDYASGISKPTSFHNASKPVTQPEEQHQIYQHITQILPDMPRGDKVTPTETHKTAKSNMSSKHMGNKICHSQTIFHPNFRQIHTRDLELRNQTSCSICVSDSGSPSSSPPLCPHHNSATNSILSQFQTGLECQSQRSPTGKDQVSELQGSGSGCWADSADAALLSFLVVLVILLIQFYFVRLGTVLLAELLLGLAPIPDRQRAPWRKPSSPHPESPPGSLPRASPVHSRPGEKRKRKKNKKYKKK